MSRQSELAAAQCKEDGGCTIAEGGRCIICGEFWNSRATAPMSDLSEKLAGIEALEQAATPGPWEWDGGGVVQSLELAVETGPNTHERVGIVPGEYVRDDDAAFIAASREAVPFLLALVREQAAKLAKVTELVRDLTDPEDCSFDHHGGCQAHGYLSLQPSETCPQRDAKEWVREQGDKA